MGWLKRKLKAVVRLIVRVVVTVVGAALGIVDFFLGFLTWPPKRLRLQIFILADQAGPIVNEADLTPAIDFARKTFKDRFNVKLLPYGKKMVEIIKEPAPPAALNVGCGWSGYGQEFGEAGEYFASHLAGWNAIPISMTFPITVFIVAGVAGKTGLLVRAIDGLRHRRPRRSGQSDIDGSRDRSRLQPLALGTQVAADVQAP